MTDSARKPGERWLEPEDGLGLFSVHECGDDGRTLTVALHQYHADALLLVFGPALLTACSHESDSLPGRVRAAWEAFDTEVG